MSPLHRKLAAEALGTFALVFVGAGAIVVDAATGGRLGHLGVALAFGGVVTVMIASLGHVSGAHLNPAVSFGFWRAGQMGGSTALLYAGAQAAGAVVAALLLLLFFPAAPGHGATVPGAGVPLPAAFAFEVMLTALLMFVILCVAHGAKEEGVNAAIAIGATVAVCALFGGPVTGASMNPARSLGPALVSGQLGELWLYLVAPPLGAWLAVPACRLTHEGGCCRSAAAGPA